MLTLVCVCLCGLLYAVMTVVCCFVANFYCTLLHLPPVVSKFHVSVIISHNQH